MNTDSYEPDVEVMPPSLTERNWQDTLPTTIDVPAAFPPPLEPSFTQKIEELALGLVKLIVFLIFTAMLLGIFGLTVKLVLVLWEELFT